jgi:hypothetical protein
MFIAMMLLHFFDDLHTIGVRAIRVTQGLNHQPRRLTSLKSEN